MLKLFVLVLLALLAVYFFFPAEVERIVSEVSGPSSAPGETETNATPGASMVPSDTTELELSLLDA
ncbi:MAG: hypothetical protein ACRD1Z_05820, partial [Vicinamibacteria bacterium]